MSSEAKIVGYCRACGKALDETNVRQAQGTIYCEEHVPKMQPTAEPINPSARVEPPSPYSTAVPPPIPHPEISPGLAFGLGILPGVGAIYNGQYGKGLMHVVVFGLMCSILDAGNLHHMDWLLSLLLAGFWAYMPFEAYHTAKLRQAGQAVGEFSSLYPMQGPAAKFPVAPVLFIGLGTLFLLSNLELLNMDRLIPYWPVLMIALGVYMLAARFNYTDRKESSDGKQ
jgi:TM2 domain-containing membrane protein YozV